MRTFRRGVGLGVVPVIGLLVAGGPALAVDPVFSNQTESAGVSITHDTSGFAQSQYAGGGTVGDFNADGWQDLFIFSGGDGDVPDHLFINQGNGQFSDQAASWGLTTVHRGKGATVGDFNGDGHLDLFMTSAGPSGSGSQPGHNKLHRNNGDGTFSEIGAKAGVNFASESSGNAWGAVFGDYDLDGDLDLFVGGFSTSSPGNEGSRLYRNNGDETFDDVTSEIGLFDGVGPVACLSISMADMDGDRYPELLLGGDFKGGTWVGSRYFRNDSGAGFTDVTVASGLGHEENGMGQTIGDFNRDGTLEWYVTSIHFPSIGWTGNKLYRNGGKHEFTEFSVSAGVEDGGYGWGAVAVDLNHDGRLDLAETNGDSSGSGSFANEQSYLWMNDNGFTFTEKAIATGFVHTGKGRALLHFDYDNDGDQDLVLLSNNEPSFLFRNDLAGEETNWLRVLLDTAGDPAIAPGGYGARVVLTTGDIDQTRVFTGGNSFLGISELSAHFGLAGAEVVDELSVQWPDGVVTTMSNVAINQTITVTRASVCSGDTNGDGVVDVTDLVAVITDWGSDGSGSGGDVTGDGTVDVLDLVLLITNWGPCPGPQPLQG